MGAICTVLHLPRTLLDVLLLLLFHLGVLLLLPWVLSSVTIAALEELCISWKDTLGEIKDLLGLLVCQIDRLKIDEVLEIDLLRDITQTGTNPFQEFREQSLESSSVVFRTEAVCY